MSRPEDYFTSTVDAAAAYERWRSQDDLDLFDTEDPGDFYDDGEEYEDEDDCGCSDPGCPCSGAKRGGPI